MVGGCTELTCLPGACCPPGLVHWPWKGLAVLCWAGGRS